MLSYKNLQITYCDPLNLSDAVKLDYKLRDTPITEKWIQRVLLAQKLNYPIDDPARFYGFGSIESQRSAAVRDMAAIVQKLKTWIPIDRELAAVDDQDTLNYFHHIFEVEHGLLDAKDDSSELQKILCELNIMVHRCESIVRGARPRHVVTYFGLPKTEVLSSDDYQYFESQISFGTVYINYAEIGKTLYDLFLDNDSYIQPAAFQPFLHYSADFVVKYWDDQQPNLHNELFAYYQKHLQFFTNLGYSWDQLSRSIGSIPVADLNSNVDVVSLLETRQYVKAVEFS